MILDQLHSLPQEVQDIIFDERNSDINGQIADTFNLSVDQLKKSIEVVMRVIVKDISVLNFPIELAKLDLQGIDTSKLALEFAIKRLWPLQDYLGGVDVLIRRLGGEVPKEKITILSTSPISAQETLTSTDAKTYLQEASKRKHYNLTRKPIHDKDDRLVEPTVENWLKDYIHFAGNAISDSLARSQYLVESKNVSSLPEDEKTNVLNFLESYGEGGIMNFRLTGDLLEVEPLVEVKDSSTPASTGDLDELLQEYKKSIAALQSIIDKQNVAYQLETESTARLVDILWNAIGLGEIDRAVASLYILADKKVLDKALREDQRFVGVLRRYINVRFGNQAKGAWSTSRIDTVYWVLFFSLVFQEKLNLTAEQAAMYTLFLSQVIGLQKKPVYIDLASGSFRFRDVTFKGNSLVLSD